MQRTGNSLWRYWRESMPGLVGAGAVLLAGIGMQASAVAAGPDERGVRAESRAGACGSSMRTFQVARRSGPAATS